MLRTIAIILATLIVAELPFVTVIMPIRNEEDFIARSLGAVLAQDYPSGRMEVIIADAMSNDGTRKAIACQIRQRTDAISIRVIDNVDRIVAKGFNRALRLSRGDIIVRVDGHTEIARDYIRQCVTLLRATGAANVGGRMDPVGGSVLSDAIALATSSRFGVGTAAFHYSLKEEWVDTVYLGAWPRDVFELYGGFDEEMVRNQDDEFNYRLRKGGGRILLSPLIQSRYVNRASFGRLSKQYFEYGIWKVRVLQKHPLQMRLRQFIPPAFVAATLASGVVALLGGVGRVAFLVIVSGYLTVNVVSSTLAAGRAKLRVITLVPAVFATLHLSYGFGFLVGLIRFSNRWLISRRPGREAIGSPLR